MPFEGVLQCGAARRPRIPLWLRRFTSARNDGLWSGWTSFDGMRVSGAEVWFGGSLAIEDLAVLDQLLDTGSPLSLLRHDDLAVRTERAAWAARRRR